MKSSLRRAPEFRPRLFSLGKSYGLNDLGKDAFSGAAVGVIAMPLAMAIAISMGMSPSAGLMTGILGGLVAAVFSGTNYQVSGPTGTMIAVVGGVYASSGSSGLSTAVFLGGAVLLLFWLFRAGGLVKYIARPVIVGFTAGTGINLVVSQLPAFFGIGAEAGETFFPAVFRLFEGLSKTDPASALAGVIALAVMRLFPKLTKKIPAALAAVVIGTLFCSALGLEVSTVGSKYGEIAFGLNFVLPFSGGVNVAGLIAPAFSIAMLASIESLLSASAADTASKTDHCSHTELAAQGLSNVACGLFGLPPSSGVLARTSANMRFGAKSPISAVVHSFTLLLAVLLLAPVAALVPVSVLAAVLVSVFYDMISLKDIKRCASARKSDAALLAATVFFTLVLDLASAVAAGVLLSFIIMLFGSLRLQSRTGMPFSLRARLLKSERYGVSTLRVTGSLQFLSAPSAEKQLKDLNGDWQILDLRDLVYVDSRGNEVIEKLKEKAPQAAVFPPVMGNACAAAAAKAKAEL